MNRRIAKKNIKNYLLGVRFSGTRIRNAAKTKAPDFYKSIKEKIRKEREARAEILGITQGVFVGDIVRVKESCPIGFLKGKVTRVNIGLDIYDHGYIEVEVIERDIKEWCWVNPGDLEHFVHFGWENTLEVVKEKA